ncbi:MAG TPA: AMP-binding protein [Solirubrobacterales bacterium]|nr:AMP-binding protein [Solirubrobacterales bacterium]
MAEVAWRPSPEYAENANVSRFMRQHGIGSIDEFRRRSIEESEWFWDAVVEDMGIEFTTPYERVLDSSGGIAWSKWFVGGRVNLTHNCVDRHALGDRGERPAIVSESEDGDVRTFTYAELKREVDAIAAGLRALGIEKGDPVAVFMPMVAEAVIAAYAIAKLGALYMPIFSGFAPSAVAARLQDARAKAIFTADGGLRRGSQALMKPAADEAVAEAPSVEHVIVYERLRADVPMTAGRDLTWEELRKRGLAAAPDGLACEDTESEDVLMIAYTSGTTGRPKGAVHVHGGFLVKMASEAFYQADLHPDETLYWVTDMGWIMGPWEMIGAGCIGATVVLYEGAPDWPEPDRVWASVEQHRVNVLGVSPTLIRALKTAGDEHPAKHDLSSLRVFGSTGEPWNPEPYRWLSDVVGGGRLPIINISGGTEVGACFISPYPVEEIKVCSLGGASHGMDIDVFDPDGNPVRGQVGELVCKRPWPGMTRGIWGDPERYMDTYWSMYPDVWRHGDWALIDDGDWYLLGRSDDTINVAGKRLGPAEVESVLVSHPLVAESAVVGVPHETKGEAIWCFCVLANGTADGVAEELSELVATELGRPFKPSRVVFVDALPKTRSAKILRRAVRAVAIGEDPGDMSSAENPQALDQIRAALG